MLKKDNFVIIYNNLIIICDNFLFCYYNIIFAKTKFVAPAIISSPICSIFYFEKLLLTE